MLALQMLHRWLLQLPQWFLVLFCGDAVVFVEYTSAQTFRMRQFLSFLHPHALELVTDVDSVILVATIAFFLGSCVRSSLIHSLPMLVVICQMVVLIFILGFAGVIVI